MDSINLQGIKATGEITGIKFTPKRSTRLIKKSSGAKIGDNLSCKILVKMIQNQNGHLVSRINHPRIESVEP